MDPGAETLRVIDTTAQKGVIHKNAAARTKSRLVRAVEPDDDPVQIGDL